MVEHSRDELEAQLDDLMASPTESESTEAQEPPEPKVRVILGEQNSEALVEIDPPVPIDQTLIDLALMEKKVVFGIDPEAIKLAATAPQEGPMKVATWKAAENGVDGKIQYYFKGGGISQGRPLELEDGRVDYRELGNIENVSRGQMLASKTPPGFGTPGTNVLGIEIPARDGKDVQIRIGQNVSLSEDEMIARAIIDGMPKLDGSRISVVPLLEVGGDVDFSTGNLQFKGSIRIAGNVLHGFTVKAEQDIEINGMVEGATIEAGGKVTVKGGVRQRACVMAHSDVSVRYVDSESQIMTRANLTVVDSAMHSFLTAGLAIKVGKKLIGGTSQAGEFISAETIGAIGGTHTVLDVRHSRQTKVIEQLKRAINKLNSQLNSVNYAYDLIVSQADSPQAAFEKTKEIKDELEARLDNFSTEHAQREAHSPRTEGKERPIFVAAKEGFNPGVHVHFDEAFYHVDTFTPANRIAELHGEISIL